jgi:integrase
VVKRKVSVSEFLARKKLKSKATESLYRLYLRIYFTNLYPELANLEGESFDKRLDEVSLRYVSDDNDYEGDLFRFVSKYPKDQPKTRSTRTGAVLSYLATNQIAIDNETKWGIGFSGAEPVTEDRIPSLSELRTICEHLPLNARAMVLVMASSGMRIGETLKLEVDDLNLKTDPARIVIPYTISKGKKGRTVLITPEAKELLQRWLPQREKYIVQAKARSKGLPHANVDLESKRVFPYTTEQFAFYWKKALRKAGFVEKDKNTRRWLVHAHSLRKFFRARGAWQNFEVAEFLMGHLSSLKETYSKYKENFDSKVIPEYVNAMSGLMIFENGETIRELKSGLEDAKQELAESKADRMNLATMFKLMQEKLERADREREQITQEMSIIRKKMYSQKSVDEIFGTPSQHSSSNS